jgi:superfamily II DNA helicase RecQ
MWRNNRQRDIILESLALPNDHGLLAVLPTGSGKSLLFLIPAMMSDSKVVVVFFPLRALVQTMAQQIRNYGIHCTVWNEEKTRNPVTETLLLVSMDYMATSTTLWTFLRRLEREDRLDRFVIDEVHTLMTSEFRDHRLQQVRKIRVINRPVIFMTATLPPSLQQSITDILCFQETQLHVHRQISARPNICFKLFQPLSTKESEEYLYGTALQHNERSLFAQWNTLIGSDKGLIYALTKREADDIGKYLNIPVYHSDLPETERHSNLSAWIKGRQSWIVGTSGLGAGINLPNIKLVVLWGLPTDIIDFVQMAGRAGRELSTSYCIIIEPTELSRSRQYLHERAQLVHLERFIAVQNLLTTSTCIRKVCGLFMDGFQTGLSCKDLHALQCWICAGNDIGKHQISVSQDTNYDFIQTTSHSTQLPSGLTSLAFPTQSKHCNSDSIHPTLGPLQQQRQREAEMREFMSQVLGRWSIGCVFCNVLEGCTEGSHQFWECLNWKTRYDGLCANRLWGMNQSWRRKIDLIPYTCCFHCGSPRSLCPQGKSGGDSADCTFGKTPFTAAFAASHKKEFRDLMVELPQQLRNDPLVFWKTLSVASQWEGEGCNRIIVFLFRIATHYGLWEDYQTDGSLI